MEASPYSPNGRNNVYNAGGSWSSASNDQKERCMCEMHVGDGAGGTYTPPALAVPEAQVSRVHTLSSSSTPAGFVSDLEATTELATAEGLGNEIPVCDYESASAPPASLAAQQHFASMSQPCKDYFLGLGDGLGDLSTICPCYTTGDEAAARAATCAPTAGARTVSLTYERCVNPPPACYDSTLPLLSPVAGQEMAAYANWNWWGSLTPTCQSIISGNTTDVTSFCGCFTSGVSGVGATCSATGSIPGYSTTERRTQRASSCLPRPTVPSKRASSTAPSRSR